jgi:hypothetical protein
VPTFRTGEVAEIIGERTGLQRVRVIGLPEGDRAYALTSLTGTVAVGDRVVLNTTAVELGLGTGGWHVIHWNLGREDLVEPGPDHVMKLRYTSLQFDAGTDELVHPDLPRELGGAPVVTCLVHSQVAVVAAVLKSLSPALTVAYLMTDGAALPLALSDLVAELRDRGLLDGTITCGHAFGGDLEAVGVASGLLLARHVLRADVIIVGMGPGVVGTGTAYGSTAADAGAALTATRALGGRPVLCVRASDGDERPRHQGISHHTVAALTLADGPVEVAPHPADVAHLRHAVVHDVALPDAAAILADLDLRVTTMGRGPEQDPLFFSTAGAAAAVAVDLLGDRER